MQQEITNFQKNCELAISKLSPDFISDFLKLDNAEARIENAYNVGKEIVIDINENNGKSFLDAGKEKVKGNEFFAKKDYDNALKCYNLGIVLCPQKTVQERELLCILISNRSATYFEQKEFKRVFNDVDYLIEIGNYPIHLQYKIWLRKAKCYSYLQKEKSAMESYDKAIQFLKDSKLDAKTIEAKIKQIEEEKKEKLNYSAINSNTKLVPFINDDNIFEGGNQYVSASAKVSFAEDEVQGRYAVAVDDIDAGTIILEENPHCMVLNNEHMLKNCQVCAISVDQPIACPNCANVIFCSTICERLSNKTFHKFECHIQDSLTKSGASVNCAMALRIVTQKPISYFKDKQNKLREYLKDTCKKQAIKKKIYRADDYDNVFFLCRNETLRKKEELLHYTIMAVYLLRLIKFAKYFPNSNDNELTNDEIYIGSLILRHLELLEFNAHEISELQNIKSTSKSANPLTNYENENIGAAVYPTLALFNHSCDPSVIRYNKKSRIIVRTIKPIKAGDIIYENYGPLYTTMSREKRQEQLKLKYKFECLCKPCEELWPLFHEMEESEMRIKCISKRCHNVFVVHPFDDPFLTCPYCKEITSILPHLKELMTLQNVLADAEHLFGCGKLQNAMKVFLEALKILYKNVQAPHPDMVKIQQRLRTCMIQFGNKASDFVDIF